MRYALSAILIDLARWILKPHDRAFLDYVMRIGTVAAYQEAQELGGKP